MALAANMTPVASLERLKEIGLDPAEYGSCSQPRQEEIPGRGRVLVNVGCKWHHECTMANVPMPDPDAEHMRPRPRHVKTRLLKPNNAGTGDSIRETWCTCAQWHMGTKPRHGLNNEIAEISGQEGDTVLLRGSEQRATNGPWIPKTWSVTIPPFPDPESSVEMAEAVYTAAVKKSSAQSADDEARRERDKRMAARYVGQEPAPVPMTEVPDGGISEAIRKAGRSGAK